MLVRSLVVLIALARLASAAPADDAVTAAMTSLVSGDFAAVSAAYEPASAPSARDIAATWRVKTRMVRIELERGAVVCLVSIAPDSNRLVSMFVAKPAAPARYVDHRRFHDERVSIGAAPYLLGATLSIPSGAGPFPAVVLVHGSGPNDRDETVGSTKVFADIAEGLASAGVIALRYDKRTFTYGDTLTNALSLDDEVIDDAVAAVRFVAARHDVSKTIVVGHSLGGLLAPEIGVRAKAVAGVVLLAPPGRAPWDIVLGQMRYLHAPTASLRELERAITVIDIGGSADILGMPFSYWHDWSQRDGVAMVKQLGKPVLVLHGDRDYQVIDADIAVWRAGLAATKLAAFVTLPGDNHLLVTGSGPPNPTEYKLPAHVDARAIDQIVRFISTTR